MAEDSGETANQWEPTALGRFVRRQRQNLGLSQQTLAARLNFHHTYISQVERGRLPDLDAPDWVAKWATALEVSAETLIVEGELWRYNIVPPGPHDLTPGERAIQAALRHLDDETRHKIAQGLRVMYGEDELERPPAPSPEE